ncbi:hypothetical protein M408DRAFT_332177, partial [Serendipita vermifera MAFF 305830]
MCQAGRRAKVFANHVVPDSTFGRLLIDSLSGAWEHVPTVGPNQRILTQRNAQRYTAVTFHPF